MIISALTMFGISYFLQFASNVLKDAVNRDGFTSNILKVNKMDTFITIRFKRKTAKRFQQFSKAHFNSHTEAMAAMLDFFFYNEISPKEKFGPTGRTIEQSIKKRLNAIIAIMRDVEKNKANPTLALLQSLFEQSEPNDKPLMLEKIIHKDSGKNRFQEKEDHKSKF